jgi:hypothetical protein
MQSIFSRFTGTSLSRIDALLAAISARLILTSKSLAFSALFTAFCTARFIDSSVSDNTLAYNSLYPLLNTITPNDLQSNTNRITPAMFYRFYP